ncbi:Hypothetical Protein FCC1311_081772 [Hondaea fermentalgiana]|uniref:Uncharacterized protein n=1 Tax=Hondaea fermentalgiana TaxID=2315210 RepID=A0A2R5GM30_9STRA|nr:Hypothetical Protein FCC1311_081772 [Hondaea fermentalgiana]|eukprot:GBG31952.1 Hypothetical Protein FCC1311_081772 [Hondaea fermentalgiana]
MLGSRVRVLGKLRLDTFVNDLDGDLSTGASTKASPLPNKNKNIINKKASDHGMWTRELIVTTMECISDPNAELLHFARAKSLTESMYSRPCDASFLSSWKQHFSRSSQGPERGSQGDTSVSEIAERTETVLGDLLIHFVQERERASQAKAGAGETLADESFYTLRDFVEADSVWREAQRRTGFRPEETRKFLNGALERLLKSGKLYHVKDLYGLVSEDFLVIPAILLVLDRFDREEGVSMYDLIKTLHEDERLRFVAQEVVESALSRLQGTGDVYEPKRRRFRLVSPAESEK